MVDLKNPVTGCIAWPFTPFKPLTMSSQNLHRYLKNRQGSPLVLYLLALFISQKLNLRPAAAWQTDFQKLWQLLKQVACIYDLVWKCLSWVPNGLEMRSPFSPSEIFVGLFPPPVYSEPRCIRQIARGDSFFFYYYFYLITIDHELLLDNFILMRSECIIFDKAILEVWSTLFFIFSDHSIYTLQNYM